LATYVGGPSTIDIALTAVARATVSTIDSNDLVIEPSALVALVAELLI